MLVNFNEGWQTSMKVASPHIQVGPGENLSSGMNHMDKMPEIMIDRDVANPEVWACASKKQDSMHNQIHFAGRVRREDDADRGMPTSTR